VGGRSLIRAGVLGECLFWVVYAAWLLTTWLGYLAIGNDHRAFVSDLAGMLGGRHQKRGNPR
jgi:hypothetical protein